MHLILLITLWVGTMIDFIFLGGETAGAGRLNMTFLRYLSIWVTAKDPKAWLQPWIQVFISALCYTA